MRVLVLLLALLPLAARAQSPAGERAARLAQGINVSWLEQYWLGTPNLAEAPLWPAEFEKMAYYGFETVRLPIAFDVFADSDAPYTVDPALWMVLDDIVDAAMDTGLLLVLDNHHGRMEDTTFEAELPRHVGIVAQMAARYADTDPDRVLFELYNEPHDLSNERWHTFLRAAIDTVRQAAPGHTLVYGGIDYNGVEGLLALDPTLDDNVIYAVHVYEPLLFTHQGAEWLGPAAATTGVPFPYNPDTMPPLAPEAVGTAAEALYTAYPEQGTVAYVQGRLAEATDWAAANTVPLWLGEFGTYKRYAESTAMANYAAALVDAAVASGIPWAYWEWRDTFGIHRGDGTLPTRSDDVIASLLDALQLIVVDTEPAIPTQTALTVYPNPTTERVLVEGARLNRVEVYDLLGRQHAHADGGRAGRLELVLPDTPGVYVLRIAHADGVTTRRVTRW
ncbi:MAG: cellulase family glycosylhydrolase [Bacteroidota bacterium]